MSENLRERVECFVISDNMLILGQERDNVANMVLPGGGIEKGETGEQAVIREIREELQIELTDVRQLIQDPYIHVFSKHGQPTHGYKYMKDHVGDDYTGEKTWFYIGILANRNHDIEPTKIPFPLELSRFTSLTEFMSKEQPENEYYKFVRDCLNIINS